MTSVELAAAARAVGQDQLFLTGIRDLDFRSTQAGLTLYSVTSAGGAGLAAMQVSGSDLRMLSQTGLPGGAAVGAPTAVLDFDPEDGSKLAVTGLTLGGLVLYETRNDGQVTGDSHLPEGEALPERVATAVLLELEDRAFVFAGCTGSAAIQVSRVGEAGRLSASVSHETSLEVAGHEAPTIHAFEMGGEGHVLVATSTGSNLLALYRVNADGRLSETDRLGMLDGPGMAEPSCMVTASLGGDTYAIIGSRGSSSLSVFQLGEDGSISAQDHVLDDLATRFEGVSHLSVATVAGAVFVAAAGCDDGLSLFQLLPGGRLLHLDTLSDQVDLTLSGISALDMVAHDGRLVLAVASEREPGVTLITPEIPEQALFLPDARAGGAADDVLTGAAGDDDLTGGDGADVLMDGGGRDRMTGGAGADVFVLADDGVPDVITDFTPGEDRLDLSGWTFLRSAAQLTVSSRSYGVDITFGDERLELHTSDGRQLSPEAVRGWDVIDSDRLLPAWFAPEPAPEPMILRGTEATESLIGGAGDDMISGHGGDDTLSGGAGNDTLEGGAGSDVYIVSDAGDRVVETAENGSDDHIYSAVDFDMAGIHAEHLTLTGAGDLMGLGNGLTNVLTGNAGNNILDGAGGPDTLIGGLGDDFYVTRTPYEIVIENPGEGIDWIRSYDTIWLPHNVEHMELRGGRSDFNGVGNDFDNIMLGNDGRNVLVSHAGDDTLDGRGGADRLVGGSGSDLYVIDDPGDVVLESGRHAGHDIVRSSIDYIMSGTADIEEIQLTGTARVGIANNMENTVVGNSMDNIIDGGGNNDVMRGGQGDDLYIVNAPLDMVIEAADGGIDTIRSYRSLKLPENVENLEMRSGNPFTAVGNALNNVMSATSGDNTLIGREGNDTLYGLDGADVFVFDRAPGPVNLDTLPDFDRAEGDTLWLREVLCEGLVRGELDASAFHLGAQAVDGEDRVIYDIRSGLLWLDSDGSGPKVAVAIADLEGAFLTASDIFIV